MGADDVKKIEEIFMRHTRIMTEDFKHQMGVMTEDFKHKPDIVIEGQQMLSEKADRLEVKIDEVETNLVRRIDAMAGDLGAHRADTEAHHGVYRVKESGE